MGVDGVSVVLSVHNEGSLLTPTLRSLGQSIDYAARRGVPVELVVVLDAADRVTKDCLAAFLRDFTHPFVQLEIFDEDLGASRNAGVAAAHNPWVALCDGDDLYSENWVLYGLDACRNSDDPFGTVAHPDFVLWFGADTRLAILPDSEELNHGGRIADLLVTNLWVSGVVVSKALATKIPFRLVSERRSWPEDWGWFAELTGFGVQHQVARRTAHFVRVKAREASLSGEMAGFGMVPYFGTLAQTIFDGRYPSKSITKSPDFVGKNRGKFCVALESSVATARARGRTFLQNFLGRIQASDQELGTYLRLNEDVEKAVLLNGESPAEHFEVHGTAENRARWTHEISPHRLPRFERIFSPLSAHFPFPWWLALEAESQSRFETLLSPAVLESPVFDRFFVEPILIPDFQGCGLEPSEVGALVLVPSLDIGRADELTENLVNFLKDSGVTPLVVATDTGGKPSSLLNRNGVPYLEFPMTNHSPQQRALCVKHLVDYWGVNWVHIAGSRAGRDFVHRIPAQVRQRKLVASISVVGENPDALDYPIRSVPNTTATLDEFDVVISDSPWRKLRIPPLASEASPEFLRLHNPVGSTARSNPRAKLRQEMAHRLLFFSRFGDLDNFDLLIDVLASGSDLECDVYGVDPEELNPHQLRRIESLAGRLLIHGARFPENEAFSQGHSIFFSASLRAGVAMALLEALAAGMYVVVPKVGVLESDLPPEVAHFYSPEDSIEDILHLIARARSSAMSGINEIAQAFIRTQHTAGRFENDVARLREIIAAKLSLRRSESEL